MLQRILAGLILVGLASAAAADPGKWNIERKTSMVDQSSDYFAVLMAENTVANLIDQQAKPGLTVHCGSVGFLVTLHWPDFIKTDGGDRVGIVWSLDGGKPETRSWLAVDKAASFTGRDGRALLQQLSSVKRMAVRVPDGHGTQEAVFDLEGIAAVAAEVGPMRCG